MGGATDVVVTRRTAGSRWSTVRRGQNALARGNAGHSVRSQHPRPRIPGRPKLSRRGCGIVDMFTATRLPPGIQPRPTPNLSAHPLSGDRMNYDWKIMGAIADTEPHHH